MGIVKTGWPDVQEYLARELIEDGYVQGWLRVSDTEKSPVYLARRENAGSILMVMPRDGWTLAWLEARDDDARTLLRTFQPGEEIQFIVGTTRGLALVQEEFEGVVELHRMYCRADQVRFRPVIRHTVTKLTQRDRSALARYPASRNRDTFFYLFDQGRAELYGCYEADDIVGYSAVLPDGDAAVVWVHVRPECWRKGYGSSLVSVSATEQFRCHDMLWYEACMEGGIASMRLCLSLGFAPVRMTCYFRGRRRPVNED